MAVNTSSEIFDAFDGHCRDLPPPAVFTQSGTTELMASSGCGWPESHYDPEKMAGLSMELGRQCGFACARVPFCITIIPQTLGCTLYDRNPGSQPTVTGSPYYGEKDISTFLEGLDPTGLAEYPRVSCILEAARIVRRKDPGMFITCGMEDTPFVTGQLLGFENYLFDYMFDHNSVTPWIERVRPFQLEYARLLSEVADDVNIIAQAALDVMAPEMFYGQTVPFTGELIRSIRGSLRTVHCCGNTGKVLEDLAKLGEDGLSVESAERPMTVIETVRRHTRMLGGVSPVSNLLMGTPESVGKQARRSSLLGYDLITPECGIPPATPTENLRALAGYRS